MYPIVIFLLGAATTFVATATLRGRPAPSRPSVVTSPPDQAALPAEVEHVQEQLAQSQAALAAAQSELDTLQQQLSEMQRENESLQEQVTTLEAAKSPAQAEALRALSSALIAHLQASEGLQTAAELAMELNETEQEIQNELDELKIQGAVKEWNGRYGVPEEVDKQIELDQ